MIVLIRGIQQNKNNRNSWYPVRRTTENNENVLDFNSLNIYSDQVNVSEQELQENGISE